MSVNRFSELAAFCALNSKKKKKEKKRKKNAWDAQGQDSGLSSFHTLTNKSALRRRQEFCTYNEEFCTYNVCSTTDFSKPLTDVSLPWTLDCVPIEIDGARARLCVFVCHACVCLCVMAALPFMLRGITARPGKGRRYTAHQPVILIGACLHCTQATAALFHLVRSRCAPTLPGRAVLLPGWAVPLPGWAVPRVGCPSARVGCPSVRVGCP